MDAAGKSSLDWQLFLVSVCTGFLLFCSVAETRVNDAGAEEFDLRLADGSTITEGRVEMLYRGKWGTICDIYVKNVEATVICNQLGFQYTEGTKFFGRGRGQILVDSLNCNGNEESILECYHKFRNPLCTHGSDLGVICSNLPPVTEEASPNTGDLRLAGGPNPYEGRVEVYVSDVIGWATICQENVDFSWAEKACQKLEYRPATSVGTMRYDMGDGPIAICLRVFWRLDTENCQLVNQIDASVTCNHRRDIDIVCNGFEVGYSGAIRLQNGTEATEGSVEIFHENVWKRICADEWGLEETKTACYQLGMPVPNSTVPGGTFGGTNKNKEFISQRFQCYTPRQRRLKRCKVTPRETPCSTGDAGVQCGIWKDAKERDFRLSGGPDNSSGRVEVFHAGQWGVICKGSSFTWADNIACRQFGFLSYKKSASSISYNLPDLPVWLRINKCSGKERSVFDCTDGFVDDRTPCHRLWDDLAVDCDPRPKAESFDVHLLNGPYPNQGIVQVLYNGLKGVICHNSWGTPDAEVICRQLGYSSSVVNLPGDDVEDLYGYATEDFIIQDLNCEGSERNLADCVFSVPSDDACIYEGTQAGVVCYSDDYPSINPRPIPGGTDKPYEQPAVMNITIGVVLGVAAFLILVFVGSKMKKKTTPPVVTNTTTQMSAGNQYQLVSTTPVVANTTTQMSAGNQYQPVNNHVENDPPPPYTDVMSSPGSYPVVTSGPSEQPPQYTGQGPDLSNVVTQTAV